MEGKEMANTFTTRDGYRVSTAMAAGAARFYDAFPDIDGIQLDTIRHFAQERFLKACTPERVNDIRFEDEAPTFYYSLLVKESLTLAQALTAQAS
jgi:hypothetical protein